MDMEAALETQRLRLLRLLAGLAFALRLVSVVPVGSMAPQWTRRYVAWVLLRAEMAVQCLVFGTAVLLYGRGFVKAAGCSAPALTSLENGANDAVPAALLSGRIARLRRVLRDLPRYARRLVRRCLKVDAPVIHGALDAGGFAGPFAPQDARIDRPPDIWRLHFMRNRFRPYRTGVRRHALRSGLIP